MTTLRRQIIWCISAAICVPFSAPLDEEDRELSVRQIHQETHAIFSMSNVDLDGCEAYDDGDDDDDDGGDGRIKGVVSSVDEKFTQSEEGWSRHYQTLEIRNSDRSIVSVNPPPKH